MQKWQKLLFLTFTPRYVVVGVSMVMTIVNDNSHYFQLSELQQGGLHVGVGGAETPELLRLRQENEALRMEVAKWKELLLLRDIRNGG